jgi:hypothetical protein
LEIVQAKVALIDDGVMALNDLLYRLTHPYELQALYFLVDHGGASRGREQALVYEEISLFRHSCLQLNSIPIIQKWPYRFICGQVKVSVRIHVRDSQVILTQKVSGCLIIRGDYQF